VSSPSDEFEREADRVAESVMRMPDTTVRLQRKCACSETGEECRGCANKALNLQRSVNGSSESVEAPAAVHAALSSAGQPLNAPTQSLIDFDFAVRER
jgi:hypothetical protein